MSRPAPTAPAAGAAAELDGVVVTRDRRTILDVPRLRIDAGCTTVLFGPNGAGKTTLLRLIAGLDRPGAGVVRVAGVRRRPSGSVAFAFQETLFVRGTVRANLALGLRLTRLPAPEVAERIDAVARDCGIAHVLDRDARTLSGGEARRASLARTLALQAAITLLDEPLAGFDRVGHERFLEELGTLLRSRRGTVVLVTHDREEAFRLADRIVVMAAGRVRAEGELRDVLARPADAAAAELLGYLVVADDDGASIGIRPGELQIGPGPRTFPFLVARVIEVGLEDRVLGAIVTHAAGIPAEITLPAGADRPRAGEMIRVSARAWVRVGG